MLSTANEYSGFSRGGEESEAHGKYERLKCGF